MNNRKFSLKKYFAITVIICVLLSVSSIAYASPFIVVNPPNPGDDPSDPSTPTSDYSIVASDGETVVQTIEAPAEVSGAVIVSSTGVGSCARVDVPGDIRVTVTDTASYGIVADSAEGGSTELNIDGNVTVADAFGSGITVDAATGGASNVTINGGVSVSGDFSIGVEAYALDNNGTAGITVKGNVTATTNPDATSRAAGVELTFNNGNTVVDVKGDVKAESEGYAQGITVWTNTGTASINVDGDVSAKSSGDQYDAAGIRADNSGGNLNIEVGGAVTSNKSGLEVSNESSEDVKIDILIEGTLSAGNHPVMICGEGVEDVLSLTVWKIDLDQKENIVMYGGSYMPGAEPVRNETAVQVEKNILYIIRMEQPTDGVTVYLDGTVPSHGFNVAKADDIVTLKSADENYKVVNAYNNGVVLPKDENGNFFLKVPAGGGVHLKVSLEGTPDLILPSNLKTIGEQAFSSGAFRHVKLSDQTEFIGPFAFADCQNLMFISIPNPNTIIDENAFGDMQELVIYGKAGSTAENYAYDHNFDFIAIS